MLRRSFIAMSCLIACSRSTPSTDAQPSAGASAAATPPPVFGPRTVGTAPRGDNDISVGDGPVVLSIGDERREYVTGIVYGSVGTGSDLKVELSTTPITCEHHQPSDGDSLTFRLASGPRKAFHAGTVVSAAVQHAVHGEDDVSIEPRFVRIKVEPVDLAPGSRLRGAIEIRGIHEEDGKKQTFLGGGKLDVEICKGAADRVDGVEAPPENLPAGPVACPERGVTTKKALAAVVHDAVNDVDYLDFIAFYDSDGVSCAAPPNHDEPAGHRFVLDEIGVTTRQRILGAPLPAAFRGRLGRETTSKRDPGWVEFDRLDLKEGGRVSGFLRAPHPDGWFAGSFDAEVCILPAPPSYYQWQ
jgi:hypothetical protein